MPTIHIGLLKGFILAAPTPPRFPNKKQAASRKTKNFSNGCRK